MLNSSLHRIVEWNPNDRNQFAVGSSGKVELYEIQNDDKITGKSCKDIFTPQQAVQQVSCSCLNWHPETTQISNSIIAYGTSTGQVSALSWSAHDELIVNNPQATSRRMCTGVKWNHTYRRYLAAGFEKSRSANEFCTVVWDLEHTDTTAGNAENSTAIIFKPVSEDPISSIAWLHDPHLLAVGTSLNCAKIYDIRMEPNSTEIFSISAHMAPRPRKVRGILPDPFNDNTFATFSDSALEPIKIWDARKNNSTKPKLTIYPYDLGTQSETGLISTGVQSAVVDVAWSTTRANILAVVTNTQRHVSFYSTFKNSPDVVTRVPVHTITIPESAKSLSWQSNISASLTPPVIHLAESAQQLAPVSSRPSMGLKSSYEANKLLLATASGFSVIDVIDEVGLGYGRDIIATSNGSKIQIKPSISTKYYLVTDIDHLMQSRCKAGYSIDTGRNIQALTEELDLLNSSSDSSKVTSKLIDVWGWLHRVESRRQDTDSACSFSLRDCGIINLLQSGYNSEIVVHTTLGTSVFKSANRAEARVLCSWAENIVVPDSNNLQKQNKMLDNSSAVIVDEPDDNSFALENQLKVGEVDYSFERAAALALWHGSLDLAVRILQESHAKILGMKSNTDGATHNVVGLKIRAKTQSDLSSVVEDYCDDGVEEENVALRNEFRIISLEYLNAVSLVAMCMAGYVAPENVTKGSNVKVWSSMLQLVFAQLESVLAQREWCVYLIAMCRFLYINVQEKFNLSLIDIFGRFGKYSLLLTDSRLALRDRIAFACTFVDDKVALAWMGDLVVQARLAGSLEVLVVTGLSPDGLDILQQFVDQYYDIQTVALLVGRVLQSSSLNSNTNQSIKSSSGSATDSWIHSKELMWLNEYRSLLNRWRMFFERASLDVELGKCYRQLNSNQPLLSAPASNSSTSIANSATAMANRLQAGRGQPEKKTTGGSSGARMLYTLPPHQDSPHIFLRCHYCSTSLPVDPIQQNQTSLSILRKHRPVINCCPHCKKQLPRCYVCLLYMGLVNPNAEFNRVMSLRRHASENAILRQQVANQENSIAVELDNVNESEQNALEYGKWFFFCQKCRHGGHATCIESWFSPKKQESFVETSHGNGAVDRNVCGVSGCLCKCQAY